MSQLTREYRTYSHAPHASSSLQIQISAVQPVAGGESATIERVKLAEDAAGWRWVEMECHAGCRGWVCLGGDGSDCMRLPMDAMQHSIWCLRALGLYFMWMVRAMAFRPMI